jgi:hypothetical protein
MAPSILQHQICICTVTDATGNRGRFTTETSVVSLSAILHWVSPVDIPSIQPDARMRARVLGVGFVSEWALLPRAERHGLATLRLNAGNITRTFGLRVCAAT